MKRSGLTKRDVSRIVDDLLAQAVERLRFNWPGEAYGLWMAAHRLTLEVDFQAGRDWPMWSDWEREIKAAIAPKCAWCGDSQLVRSGGYCPEPCPKCAGRAALGGK